MTFPTLSPIPLSSRAVELLQALPTEGGDGFVFVGSGRPTLWSWPQGSAFDHRQIDVRSLPIIDVVDPI